MSPGVSFSILGPLEVTVEGTALPVGGPKPRAVLAALLLQRGTVISLDQLVTAAWGSNPPHDAVGSLRAYVSRLRSVLEQPAVGPLYRAPGYVLDAPGPDVDSVRFTNLVSQARERAEQVDHAAALELLDTALGLWRGDALAEFDAARIDPGAELARLEGLRLAATEDRAEALLELDRAREAVIPLESLTRRFPDRERPAVLLMQALYGSGRQADALEVFRTLRQHLVEELGVEPSEPTRLVHRQLLNQDAAVAAGVAVAPTNLPRRGTGFVGRTDDVALVASVLRENPLVTVTGVGGVGKSRLALEVAARERTRFDDGVWLCELAALTDGAGVSRAVATTLRVVQRHGRTIEETVVEYLSDRNLLLVLDNCEHVLADVVAFLDRVLSRCPHVVVLTTSREALSAPGEQLWPLAPLPVEEATTLFVQRARASRPRFELDPAVAPSVAEICRRLDGLPLAIELAAARMRVMSAAEVLGHLGDGHLLARESPAGAPRHHSLEATIDWSYQLLNPAEQRLFVGLSVFVGGADLAAVHAVCGEPGSTEVESLDLLTALVDKSMVVVLTSPGTTRYRVLETLRTYGLERRSADSVLARRHASYFVDLAAAAARGVQSPDEAGWIEQTLPDVGNFRAAFEHAAADRDADLALRLVSSLPEVSQLRVGYESAAWAERALDLAPAGHPLYVATVGAAARGAWNVGDFDRARALADRAAGRAPEPGTPRTAYPGDVLADIALYQGDVERALLHYTSAVTTARPSGDPIRLVWTLYYVAVCHAVRRDPARGLAEAEECLQVAEATRNPTARSMAKYALGLVLKKTDPGRALELFDEAAGLGASVHNFWWQGIALMEAAATRAVHEDPLVAARSFVDVLDHWQRVGDWTQQWLNLRYITRLLVRLDAREEAVTLHHCLVAAGKPSPLSPERVGGLLDGSVDGRLARALSRGRSLSEIAAVAYAKSSLRQVR